MSFFSFQTKQQSTIFKISHTEADSSSKLSSHISSLIKSQADGREVIVVCVGTDRSTGDSLGPLVGTQLQRRSPAPLHLYGTLDEPVHAINLKDTLDRIEQQFHRPFIIAIDACLGQLASVGSIQIGEGPVKPGAGVNKDLPPVGDCHITGIVNVGGFMEYFVLQNTRLSLVVKMAETISDSLLKALSSTRRKFDMPAISLD